MPPRRRLAAVPSEPKVGAMTAAVLDTLGKLALAPEDAALAKLAEEYGRTIDRAAAIAAQAAALPKDPDIVEELEKIRKRVSAQATMGDLGPRLLAALVELGATPKARAAVHKPPAGGRKSKLAELRSEVAQ